MKRFLIIVAYSPCFVFVVAMGSCVWFRTATLSKDSVARPISRPQVLVFKEKVPTNTVADSSLVQLRPIRDNEIEFYMRNRTLLMAAVPVVVDFRILATDVDADVPVLKSHFRDLCGEFGPFTRGWVKTPPRDGTNPKRADH